jgi:hypothetical protein
MAKYIRVQETVKVIETDNTGFTYVIRGHLYKILGLTYLRDFEMPIILVEGRECKFTQVRHFDVIEEKELAHHSLMDLVVINQTTYVKEFLLSKLLQ